MAGLSVVEMAEAWFEASARPATDSADPARGDIIALCAPSTIAKQPSLIYVAVALPTLKWRHTYNNNDIPITFECVI